ncbi:MAG: hypothetical protein BGO96_04670 [Micrococcales bacterium 73-15]|nr:MAG: hypothetical protein BGO96_04670 [Micrococcales bacterium 73-15]
MIGWGDILQHWSLVELDLHEVYGADLHDPALDRPWPWWRARITGLLSMKSRLVQALTAA